MRLPIFFMQQPTGSHSVIVGVVGDCCMDINNGCVQIMIIAKQWFKIDDFKNDILVSLILFVIYRNYAKKTNQHNV